MPGSADHSAVHDPLPELTEIVLPRQRPEGFSVRSLGEPIEVYGGLSAPLLLKPGKMVLCYLESEDEARTNYEIFRAGTEQCTIARFAPLRKSDPCPITHGIFHYVFPNGRYVGDHICPAEKIISWPLVAPEALAGSLVKLEYAILENVRLRETGEICGNDNVDGLLRQYAALAASESRQSLSRAAL